MPRWIALGAFLALAFLMLLSGFAAVHMLGEMHVREDAIRHAFATRTRVFTNLVVSVQSCNGDIPRTASGEPDPSIPELLDKLAGQINTGLASYSGPRYAAEQERLRRIADLVAKQKTLYATVFAWPPEQRQRQAQSFIRDQIMPVQTRMIDWAAQVQVWNTERMKEDDDAVVADLADVQSDLTRILWVALGSGLLLIAASLGYMVRMERQSRERVLQLSESSRELQRLSACLVDAQETERRNISRELHDEVGQSLGALLVDIGRLAANPPAGQPETKDQLDRMKSAAERTLQTVRNIALLLRPSMLDDLGLAAAIEWQGREVSRRSKIEVDVQNDNVSADLPEDYRICLYRVVQEALNNAVKHSNARNAKVLVRQTASAISARVSDDGRGFDPARTRGMGLLGMEERVKRLKGTLTIDSHPSRGTTVTVELPLPPASGSAA